MVKILKFYISVLLFVALVTCCDGGEHGGAQTGIRFVAHVPQFTKAQQNAAECVIREIDAVVFVKNGAEFEYAYSVAASGVDDNGDLTYTFELTLQSEENPVKIHIYANAHDAVVNGALSEGDSESVVKGKITVPFSASGISTDFPMWGEYTSVSGILPSESAMVVNLSALRAIARVDITATDVAAVFTMQSAQVFRASSLAQIAPDSYIQSPMRVVSPSVPASSTPTINTQPITVAENASIAQLYLPESNTVSEPHRQACCVVVGGLYDGSSKTTYYRIDFIVDGGQTGEILRNNLYTFNVRAITSEGWETPDEAANNAPVGIVAVAEDWTDQISDIGFSGSGYFWIKYREVETTNAAGSYAYFPVATNVLEYTMQWCDSGGVPQGVPATSLSSTDFEVSKGRNSIVVRALNDNPSGAGARVAYILVSTGRTQLMITVTQPDQ